MSAIIALASGKGGVGKTVTCSNLAICLAAEGKTVTIVDADLAMPDLGVSIGMYDKKTTLHDVLAGEATIEEATYDGPGGIKFIPSSILLDSYLKSKPDKMADVLGDSLRKTDYALIDLPASLTRNVVEGILLSDYVLILTTPDPTAISDSLKIRLLCDKLGLRAIGVVVLMVRGDKVELTKEQVEAYINSDILAWIKYDDRFRMASKKRKPMIIEFPDSDAAKSYKELAKEVIRRVEGEPRQANNDKK